MTKRQWLVGIVLFGFALLNAYVVYQFGYSGFVELVTANAATVALLVDLTIALSLIAVWMWNDARDRGISPLPYLALTLLLGSIGPLAYLLRTGAGSEAAVSQLPAGGVMSR